MRASDCSWARLSPDNARLRFAAGVAGLALAAAPVRPDRLGPNEQRVFGVINRLPDGLAGPLWLVMQGGNFAAAPAAAALALYRGRPALARRLVIAGPTTWLLVKVVKRRIQRPRPAVLVLETRRRGREQSGLGFVSGHAAVATSLCAAALPDLGPSARRAAVAGAITVGVARVYIGAHLPLDVLGGIALGLAVEAAVEVAESRLRGRWPVRGSL
jgi:glycosyltransferase 2 family protein